MPVMRKPVSAALALTAAALSAAALLSHQAAAAAPQKTATQKTATTTDPLTNGTFEAGLTGWTCSPLDSAVNSPVHSGGQALKGAASAADYAQCAQTVSVQPGATYTLSAYVRGAYVYLGATGTGVNASTWTPNAADWAPLTTTFTTGAGTTSVTVFTHGWYGQGTYGADDVVLSGPGGSGGSTGGTGTPPPTASPTTPTPPPTTTPPPSGGSVVPVSTSAQLKDALAAARPGQTIRLADGTYTGNFKTTASGTAQSRITLTGSARAVLTTSTGGGDCLYLNGASYWTVKGITVTHAQKAIMLDTANHVVIDSVTVYDTTMEGIHFRNSSQYGVLENSTVHDTGTAHDGKGEGVYVGTANTLTDQSDYVQILNNTIGPDVGAENIDLKEGTTGGLVSGNTFDGNGLTLVNYDDSWIDVKGNAYTIENNHGVHTLKDGFQTHTVIDGWGCGTVFRHNTADLTGASITPSYAIDVTNYDSAACPVTVTRDNTVTAGTALTNPGIPLAD
jgi:hypothetical protein